MGDKFSFKDSGFTVVPIDEPNELPLNCDIQLDDNDNEILRFKKILSYYLSTKYYSQSRVFATNQLDYFVNYLRYYDKDAGFWTRTIVIEWEYISESYLKDYSYYYSLGFRNYDRICRRIHFFQEELSLRKFDELIVNDLSKGESERIWTSYLGNIVVKPLPNSLFGASLIKNYDDYFHERMDHGMEVDESFLNRKRNFIATRRYSVNIFGHKLELNTLVHQEQDRIIATCASIAIWMATHKISYLFRTRQLAPSQITELAGPSRNAGRKLPNTGLDVRQIVHSMNSIHPNIVCEVYAEDQFRRLSVKRSLTKLRIIEPWQIKRIVYAYLRLGIPILLGYKMAKTNANHIVTLTGYRLEKTKKERELSFKRDHGIKLESDRIQRLFAHDDQLGPFAKIGFGDEYFPDNIKVNWRGESRFNMAIATSLIIPVDDIIRVKYDDVEEFAENFTRFLNKGLYKEELIWDIYLQNSNSYKTKLPSLDISADGKKRLLEKSFPKYVWIAEMRLKPETIGDGTKLVDFIFDATDHAQGHFLFDLLYHDGSMKENLSIAFSKLDMTNRFKESFKKDILLRTIQDSLGLKIQ